jgi:aspartyl-tRNA(Asn)/glutamyl-tRNA(Gln) amidotransferase subunit A
MQPAGPAPQRTKYQDIDAFTIARYHHEHAHAKGDFAVGALSLAPAMQAKLNCFVDTLPHLATLQLAAIAKLPLEARRALPLAGVPVVIKDNICIGPEASFFGLAAPIDKLPKGWQGRTTCASRMLDGYHSPFSATCVERLLAAGAVPIAKANMDEFGFGSSGEHSCFGPTRNPLDEQRVPGGSSSGSAAAVASGLVRCALGSDTGGSVRQPAAFCGLAAMKPTYGRVSRSGLVAYASSLDQVGPIARSVREVAALLHAIAGHDARDATSVDAPTTDIAQALAVCVQESTGEASSAGERASRLLAGKRIALPAQAQGEGNHPGVAQMLASVRSALVACGAHVVDVDLPSLRAAVAAYYIVAPAEASSNLARFDGVRYGHRASAARAGQSEDEQQSLFDFIARNRSEGFGHEAQRRILLGTHVLSSGYYDAYYLTALKARRLVLQEFERVLRGPGPTAGATGAVGAACDAVLLPTTPGPAFKLGAKQAQGPLAMYLEDVYTVPINLTGLPALQVPAGHAMVDGQRLPLGVQLVGPAMSDGALLMLGQGLELAVAAHAPTT